MDKINPLSKFLIPLISFIYGEDSISVLGIICDTIWGSFLVLGSFAIQFAVLGSFAGRDHFWACTDIVIRGYSKFRLPEHGIPNLSVKFIFDFRQNSC